MARKQSPDWYIQEWMAALEVKAPQASMQRELGYSRGKANQVYHGDVRYNRDLVNEISTMLKIRPYELLMPPDEAMALRRQRDAAAVIVQVKPVADIWEKATPAKKRKA